MSDSENDGAAYLKALRAGGDSGAAVAPASIPAAAPGNLPAENEAFAGPERRASPRYKCEGGAEMREPECDVRTWAAFKDISLHGCYVEANATYPVGTVLELKLDANGFQVKAKGVVRANYPFLGMGIAFTEMTPENRAQLKELVCAMSRPAVVMGTPPPAPQPLNVPPISEPGAAVRAMVTHFETHATLSRDAFLALLRKSQEKPTKTAR